MYIYSTNLEEIIEVLIRDFKDKTVVISLAENTNFDINELIECLVENDIQFIGGIFPKIIHNVQVFEQGMILTGFSDVEKTFLVEGLNTTDFEVPSLELDSTKDNFFFTFVDGLTTNLSLYLSELYSQFGSNMAYFGSGAGSLSLKQIPCVFNKDGIFQDAAVGFIAQSKVALGVKHGWKRVAGPFIATKTEKNVIKQINWQNAFEVYKTIVEEHGKAEIRKDNFFDISKAYPFGILKDNSEYVVRDPLSVTDEGELVCIGEVLENTVMDILKGDNETLVKAAEDAAEAVIDQLEFPHHAYISDCISRVLFLEDDYHLELEAILGKLYKNGKQIPLEGALTLGEISSFGDGYLQLFNKTVVIGLFEK
ncbi:FIST C-terminal domain-containing protein [Reichenbachiella sp. MALMAid0571]|uniref:FIST signal transduction protein n=1 Tax=Reichenbachiella sp. MALMAid0571 TaxID=3143939 RepID=UPI0032DF4CB5